MIDAVRTGVGLAGLAAGGGTGRAVARWQEDAGIRDFDAAWAGSGGVCYSLIKTCAFRSTTFRFIY